MKVKTCVTPLFYATFTTQNITTITYKSNNTLIVIPHNLIVKCQHLTYIIYQYVLQTNNIHYIAFFIAASLAPSRYTVFPELLNSQPQVLHTRQHQHKLLDPFQENYLLGLVSLVGCYYCVGRRLGHLQTLWVGWGSAGGLIGIVGLTGIDNVCRL